MARPIHPNLHGPGISDSMISWKDVNLLLCRQGIGLLNAYDSEIQSLPENNWVVRWICSRPRAMAESKSAFNLRIQAKICQVCWLGQGPLLQCQWISAPDVNRIRSHHFFDPEEDKWIIVTPMNLIGTLTPVTIFETIWLCVTAAHKQYLCFRICAFWKVWTGRCILDCNGT